MKKSLLLISLLCFSVAMLAAEETDDVKGAHPYKVEENEEGVAEEFFDALEKVLLKKQIETNNYGYGELEKFVKNHEDSTR